MRPKNTTSQQQRIQSEHLEQKNLIQNCYGFNLITSHVKNEAKSFLIQLHHT